MPQRFDGGARAAPRRRAPKHRLADAERFHCPFPGCERSCAELWRLKVHYRAPSHIRGSGVERGHDAELQHCPKCGEWLEPGKHHFGCRSGLAAPRQAVHRRGDRKGGGKKRAASQRLADKAEAAARVASPGTPRPASGAGAASEMAVQRTLEAQDVPPRSEVAALHGKAAGVATESLSSPSAGFVSSRSRASDLDSYSVVNLDADIDALLGDHALSGGRPFDSADDVFSLPLPDGFMPTLDLDLAAQPLLSSPQASPTQAPACQWASPFQDLEGHEQRVLQALRDNVPIGFL